MASKIQWLSKSKLKALSFVSCQELQSQKFHLHDDFLSGLHNQKKS